MKGYQEGQMVVIDQFRVPNEAIAPEFRRAEQDYINSFSGKIGVIESIDPNENCLFPVMVDFGTTAKIRRQRFSGVEIM